MGWDIYIKLRRLAGKLLRPLIPIVQDLFGMTRQAARGAIIWFLQGTLACSFIALTIWYLTGANFLELFKHEFTDKFGKNYNAAKQLEAAKKIDQQERLAVPSKPSAGTANIQAGSIPPNHDGAARRAEAECNAIKSREVAALVELRKAAFGAYTRCLIEYKPASSTDLSTQQFCDPKYKEHIRFRDDANKREAQDCSTVTTK
jgi:hypothetical protein